MVQHRAAQKGGVTRKGSGFVVLARKLPYATNRGGEASSVVVESPVTLV